MGFTDLEKGLTFFLNAAIIFEVFCILIVLYGLVLCCCGVYKKGEVSRNQVKPSDDRATGEESSVRLACHHKPWHGEGVKPSLEVRGLALVGSLGTSRPPNHLAPMWR